MDKNTDILVLCDGSAQTGLGHLSRCLGIAASLKKISPGIKILFQGDYSTNAAQILAHYQMDFCTETFAIDKQPPLPCLIVDKQSPEETQLAKLAGRGHRIVLIDDFNRINTAPCTLVINFRVGAERYDYSCGKTALGMRYFPARPELKAIRESRIARKHGFINNILISIGGFDHFNIGPKVARELATYFRGIKINLVTNITPDDFPACGDVTVFPLQNSLHGLLRDADFVISGGGLIKYECIYCGIPNGCFNQTEDQREDTEILAKEGLTVNFHAASAYRRLSPDIIGDIGKEAVREDMRSRMCNLTVSDSAEQLACKILEVCD